MSDKRGMTLIEIIVALAIFMILIAMAFPIILQSGLINVESQRRQNAEAQGVLLAEYLIYNASDYESKNKLIDFLTDPDSPRSDFSAFSCAADTCAADIYSLNQAGLAYTITFDTEHRVYISVKLSKQVYESMVYLSYQGGGGIE